MGRKGEGADKRGDGAAGEGRKRKNKRLRDSEAEQVFGLADDEQAKEEKNAPADDVSNVIKMSKKSKKKKKVSGESEEKQIFKTEEKPKFANKKSQSKVVENGGDICNGNDGKILEVEELQVSVSGRDSSNPKFAAFETFTAAELPAPVMNCCSKFLKPSPIQAHTWPFLLDGRDLIGIARTGSGKTLAFGVPALKHVLNTRGKQKSKQPLCLVLSPTRELAQQIAAVLEEAGASCNVKVTCIYGGSAKGPQKAALKSGCDIVVATPGRLQDLLDEGVCTLGNVTYLVLDEADRMLDLGFEPAVRAIVAHIPKKRQTIMFSATWPVVVEKLAQEFISDSSPVKITVGSQDLAANHDVTQIVEVLDDKARLARLEELLRLYHKTKRNRVLVFVLYKKEAVWVENHLQGRGWKVKGIHGDKSQDARNQALAAFKDGSHPLLIATDVAARGLDIPDVEYVINYSFPLTTEDYVHRIGRTGRAGKKGIAHTFFTASDKSRSGELVNILKEAGQTVPEELLKFGTHVKKKESKLYGAHFKEIAADAPKAQKTTFDSDDE